MRLRPGRLRTRPARPSGSARGAAFDADVIPEWWGNRQPVAVDDCEQSRGSGRANAYAAWARAGQDLLYAPALDAVVELLPPPPLEVLDVGCGEGRLGKALLARGYDVVGVDLDPAMVALASEYHPAQLADATALPFAPEQFDAVVSAHVFMEIESLDAALTELSRVVRLNGSW